MLSGGAPAGYRGNSTLPTPKEERTLLRVQGGGAGPNGPNGSNDPSAAGPSASKAESNEKAAESYTGNTILVGDIYRVRDPNNTEVLKEIIELQFTPSEKALFQSIGFDKTAIRDSIRGFPKDPETNQFAIFWKNYVLNDCKDISRFYTKKECYAVQTFLRSIEEVYNSYLLDTVLKEVLEQRADPEGEGVKGGVGVAPVAAPKPPAGPPPAGPPPAGLPTPPLLTEFCLLMNNSNYCYLNSVIQFLCSMPEIVKLFTDLTAENINAIKDERQKNILLAIKQFFLAAASAKPITDKGIKVLNLSKLVLNDSKGTKSNIAKLLMDSALSQDKTSSTAQKDPSELLLPVLDSIKLLNNSFLLNRTEEISCITKDNKENEHYTKTNPPIGTNHILLTLKGSDSSSTNPPKSLQSILSIDNTEVLDDKYRFEDDTGNIIEECLPGKESTKTKETKYIIPDTTSNIIIYLNRTASEGGVDSTGTAIQGKQPTQKLSKNLTPITVNDIITIDNKEFYIHSAIVHYGEQPEKGHYVLYSYRTKDDIAILNDGRSYTASEDDKKAITTGGTLFLYRKLTTGIYANLGGGSFQTNHRRTTRRKNKRAKLSKRPSRRSPDNI